MLNAGKMNINRFGPPLSVNSRLCGDSIRNEDEINS